MSLGYHVHSKSCEHYLFHLEMDHITAKKVFGDCQYIGVGGTESRVLSFATLISEKINQPIVTFRTSRYTLFKVGPVIGASHGMGAPSISILMNELILALKMAGRDLGKVEMFRMGTSGGIGVEPGTVVITSEALNEKLEPFFEIVVMGETMKYPTQADTTLVEKLSQYPGTVVGKTMSANCFYENQGRIEAAYSTFSYDEKENFVKKLHNSQVKNIEMEGVAFSALARRARVRACVVCVILVNRLKQEIPDRGAEAFASRPVELVVDYIMKNIDLQARV